MGADTWDKDTAMTEIALPDRGAAGPAALPVPAGGACATPRLTRRQKAAVIVRLLLEDGQVSALSHLEDGLQADLTEAMASMRYVDRRTLIDVVREFLEELKEIGITFPGGLDRALELLDSHISAQARERLRLASSGLDGNDPWLRLARLTPEELLPLLASESPLVAAVVLSKLSTAQAAALLEQTEGPRARAIALAMPATSATGPDAVAQIGATLAARLDHAPLRAFDATPAARIGAILNMAPSLTRDSLLDDLDSADQDFAVQVRRTIFAFNDIPDRVEPTDVAKAIRGVDNETMITALAAAADSAPDAAEFLLSNMSKRLAAQLREEISERPPVKRKAGDAAMTAVVQNIRQRHEAGDITMIPLAEEDEG